MLIMRFMKLTDLRSFSLEFFWFPEHNDRHYPIAESLWLNVLHCEDTYTPIAEYASSSRYKKADLSY